MKSVMANVSNSFFVRNFLRSSACETLLRSGQVRLILLAPKGKLDYYRVQFPDKSIIFDVMPDVDGFRIDKIFKYFETASIHTKTSYMLSKANLHRTGSKSPFILRNINFGWRYLIWQLGKFQLWRELLRNLYFLFPNSAFSELIVKYKPDLVFLPSMIYLEDYILAKEAKKRKIKTLGMTLSWDNFYSKTLLLVKPDFLMVHTELIVNQARKMGDYDGEITATGIPQYDRYFKKEGISSREEFFKKIGADPAKKLILYAFSGKAALNLEFAVLDVLHEIIKRKTNKEDIQVLLRPYPRYDFSNDKLRELREKYNFLAAQPVSHPIQGSDNWEFDSEALNFLSSSLAHADLVITMYSTFFIEAALFDRPIIAVAFDGNKNLDYWNSSKRFFDWDHLAELKAQEGLKISKNEAELDMAIDEYLEKPFLLAEGRKRIVIQQCQFTDGKSGERLAKTILAVLGLQ